MKKRILALLLVLSMLVSVMPTVFAADTPAPAEASAADSWEFWKDGFTKKDSGYDGSKETSLAKCNSGWVRFKDEGFASGSTQAIQYTSKNDVPASYTFQAQVQMDCEIGYVTLWPHVVDQNDVNYKIVMSVDDGFRVAYGAKRGYVGAVDEANLKTSNPVAMTHKQAYILKYTVEGNTLSVKIWPNTESEPEAWNYVIEDDAIATYAAQNGTKFCVDYYYNTSDAASLDQNAVFHCYYLQFTAPVSLKAAVADSKLVVGETSDITVTPSFDTEIFEDAEVNYASDNDEIVTVDVEEEKITAVGAGETTITASITYGDNTVSVELPVTVTEPTYVAKIGEQSFETLDDAFDAAQDGDEVKILEAGTYALSTSGKDITITGAVEGVVFDNIGAKNMGSANVTFNNVTFDYYPNVNYTGLQHSGNLTYNNCVFNGQVFLYGASEIFVECTFNQNSADAYNVWTYGAKEVAFKECTFNSAGKSVLVYNEGACATELTVVDSDFIASAPVEGKAAIEIDTTLMPDGTSIAIDAETTATGFGTGSVSGNSLWNDKKNQEDLSVTVGDKVVWPVFLNGSGTEEDPYLINNVADLKLFAEKVDGGKTFVGQFFKLTADIDLYEMGDGEPVTFNTIGDGDHPFSGTFDGDGHTISNLYQSGWALGYDWYNYGSIGLFGSIDGATIKNLTIKNAECFVEGGDVGGIAGSATGDCVFENITITDSVMATYNNGCGGIIGWAGAGSYTFKGVTVDEDTVIAGLWGSFDSSLGGIMGQLDKNATAHFEDVDVSCRLDAYNDITASYKYYNYRMCGMLIGRVLAVDENGKLDPAANGITLGDNVVVTFGDWANYNYINNKVNGYGWQRVEPGYAYDGVDVTEYPDAEIIYQTFDKLFSGTQYGGYGVDSYTDPSGKSVTVIAPPDALKYVSIGDSMANGYCFEGYEQGEEGKINFFAGTGVYGKGAYPLQFERWLQEQGQAVDHTKLAPSAMRAEDLHYLLGGREMPNDDWYDEVNGYTEVYDNEKLKEFFQTAVAEADIITMGVGNASFGAYMLHRVTDALGVLGGNLSDSEKVTLEQALVGLDEEQKSIVLEVYNTMMAQLKAYVPAELAEQFSVEEICNIVAYTVAGFIVNYEGSLEQIVALNPDVEVILVGLMNTTYGMEITGEGVSVPVGDIMDEVFGALNAYIAALPAVKQANGEWTDATFYYAEQPNPKFISQEFDTLKEEGWTTVDRLDGQTVRERNIKAYNDSLREIISDAFSTMLSSQELPEITLSDVTNNNLTGLKKYSVDIYLGIEDAVAESCDTLEIPLESLIRIATSIESVFADFTPGQDLRSSLAEYLTGSDVLQGMCKIYALFKVGNGMSVHPTPAGHDEIADAVIAAYENGYTAEDATKDNIEEYAKKALWLLTEYYDDVYAMVYDKLDEQGYVAASVAALEYAKAQIAAIDVDALDLSDEMKAELKEEAALAIEAIEALQTLLLTAYELDDETVKAAQALLDDLTDALENMNDILAVAGTDLENVVREELGKLEAAVRAEISAAIERAETAVENLKKYIDEDIAPAVRAEIEELIETIEGQLEYLQAVVDGTVEATIDQINKALAALEQAVTDLIKAAQNEADQLLQAMLDELKALAEATVAEFEAALYEATHISMSNYDDQYYVSLGGATAYGAGVGRNDPTYDELVVDALEAEGIDVTFSDCTDPELDYAGLVDYVKANAAEIAKATLITYNMDASGFLMSLFGNDPDWSAYFDEAEVKAAIAEIQAEVLALQSKLAAELDAEALAALAQAEDDVLAALTEQIDPETAKEIAPYAEKLLYAAVSYAVETAKALEAIQTINPEAEIMLVGMYNPLAGTTLTVKGEVINLGEIVEYAMEATDLYHLIYAVANDKVAFVDVSETTVDGLGNLNVDDPKTMINSLAVALMNASAKISANAAGHEYIAEQIIGAIDFVGMLGDINLDGEVDTADAVAAVDAWLEKIELNELQKNNGDVNFDGAVDAADAALIVDFWLEKIQSFEK